jgi:uncharacterized membrane protein YfcA
VNNLTPLAALFGFLGAFTAFHAGSWWIAVRRASVDPRAPAEAKRNGFPSALELGTGLLTDFLDTLGIGSFAPTTSIYKFFRIVPDRLIPGTLNVGHTLPSIAEAFIFTVVIDVDSLTLILMIAAASAGAWLGAGVVAGWSKKKVQVGLGFALLAAAALFIHRQWTGDPAEAGALGLAGFPLAVGVAGNFIFGALMTLGVGLYAPCMILVCLLGMNPQTAFPIMMGSCAFLMPVGSARFLRKNAYALRPALGLTLGGLPGVFAAAYLVKELPLSGIRWLVIAVVLSASLMMLRSAIRNE